MADVYWGVDSSYYPANKEIRVPRRDRMTVWQYVCEAAANYLSWEAEAPGFHIADELSLSPEFQTLPPISADTPLRLPAAPQRQPEFWGRYLGHHQITREEADFIFEKSEGNCRILLVYNRTNQTIVRGNKKRGFDAAQDAVSRAKALNVPPGTFIYIDIEGKWTPSAAFLEGWWDGMTQSIYGGQGGIYCKTTAPNFLRPYLSAMRGSNGVYRRDPPLMERYIWTTRPQVRGHERPGTYLTFSPIEPADRDGFIQGVTVIHQYALDKLRGMVDFNIANQDGYDSMWRQV